MITIIAAISKNNVIGKDGRLPWLILADLKHFKETTSGHTIVMGRKTYESIGRPLPNRKNVILTRDKDYKVEGCEVVHSVDDCLKIAKKENVYIIGGASIYEQFLPYADQLDLTRVDAQIEGDTYFPEVDWSKWHLKSSSGFEKDEKNDYGGTFESYTANL